MPRPAASLDEIVKEAVEAVVKRAATAIARSIAETVAARLDAEIAKGLGSARRGRGRPVVRRPRGEINRWTADRRARRVPNFVIEATALKTKKAIVAKYGENVTFEKGKPLPKAK